MATILPLGIQFMDGLGVPLANGTLTFYIAGTTTLKSVYNNKAQSSTLSNPFTLDAEGRIPAAGLWGNGSYRVLVKNAAGVTIYDLDNLDLFNPYDWSGLTATVADINAISGGLGTAGVVVANKTVVVDASKNIATFGTLSAANIRANTSIRTPLINDGNNVAAITIPSVTSQVNSIQINTAISTISPSIAAIGADTNIDLKLAGKGTGTVALNGLKYPVGDGTAGQFLTTSGAGVLSFATVTNNYKATRTVSTSTFTSTSSVIPLDNTIPQISEGTEVLTLTFTPSSASSTLYYSVVLFVGSGTSATPCAAVFRDGAVNAINAAATTILSGGAVAQLVISGSIATGATTSTTFSVRLGPGTASTIGLNGNSARLFGGASTSTMTIIESA